MTGNTNDIFLGVNIDHVATLRQARLTSYPDIEQAAADCEAAGADAITIHLREDRRHIQDKDVFRLRDLLQTRMNLEMAVTDEMIEIATRVKPQDCCLVPEKREELTTEGGLDVTGQLERVRDACLRLKDAEIKVSLFIDADITQVEAAADAGAPVIEIHTGHFADAQNIAQTKTEFERIKQAVQRGVELGLQVNAGHGLHYDNVMDIAGLPGIRELNIGHSIVARAIFVGLQQAVSEMKALMHEARNR